TVSRVKPLQVLDSNGHLQAGRRRQVFGEYVRAVIRRRREYWRITPRDDSDLREGAAGAPENGHRQADRLGAGRRRIERCVTQTRHSGGPRLTRAPEPLDRGRLAGRGNWRREWDSNPR